MMLPKTYSPRCEAVSALLPAYALNALTPEEALIVGTHLSACPACRAELTTYEGVVDALGATAPITAPPASLRVRVLQSAAALPAIDVANGDSQPVTTDGDAQGHARFAMRRFVAPGLAAAAVVLVAAAVVMALLLADAREARDDAVAVQGQLASYLSAGGRVTPLSALAAADYGYTQGRGSLVTAPGMAPLVVVGGCPPTDEDRVYRVWLARDGDRTSVGEVVVNEQGSGWLTVEMPEPMSTYDSIGVTMVSDDSRRDVFVGPWSATVG